VNLTAFLLPWLRITTDVKIQQFPAEVPPAAQKHVSETYVFTEESSEEGERERLGPSRAAAAGCQQGGAVLRHKISDIWSK